jgi:hypothetical protein
VRGRKAVTDICHLSESLSAGTGSGRVIRLITHIYANNGSQTGDSIAEVVQRDVYLFESFSHDVEFLEWNQMVKFK